MPNMKNEYIIWADALKGFAIFLMVMGHAIAWNCNNYEVFIFPFENNHFLWGGIVWNLIYSFHMPLLFFISAYLSYKTEFLNFNLVVKNTSNKFIRLMFPFFITGFIPLFLKGVYGYWFLLVLFEYYVVYYLFSFINSKINKTKIVFYEIVIILIPFVITFLITRIYNDSLPIFKYMEIEKFFNNYLFFIFGIFLRKYNKLEVFALKNKVFTMSFLLFIISFLILKYRIITISFPLSDLLIRSVMIFAAIIVVLNVFFISFNKCQNIFQKWFIYLGKHTLEIYLFHILFVIQIPEIGQFILSQDNPITIITLQLIMSIVFAFIAIFFSLAFGNLLSKSNVLKYFVLGKGKLER